VVRHPARSSAHATSMPKPSTAGRRVVMIVLVTQSRLDPATCRPNTADQLRSGAPVHLAGGPQGGTSACRTGAALSFVSCIRLLGGSRDSSTFETTAVWNIGRRSPEAPRDLHDASLDKSVRRGRTPRVLAATLKSGGRSVTTAQNHASTESAQPQTTGAPSATSRPLTPGSVGDNEASRGSSDTGWVSRDPSRSRSQTTRRT